MVNLTRGVAIAGVASRDVIVAHQAILLERARAILDFRGAERRGHEVDVAHATYVDQSKAMAALEAEHRIPFAEACHTLGLSQQQRDALVLIAAPHVDDVFRDAIARYWVRPTRNYVDPALVVEVLCLTRAEAIDAATSYHDGGPLHAAGLIESVAPPIGRFAAQIEHELVPTPRLLRLLNGRIGLDPRFRQFAAVVPARADDALGVVTPERFAETVALAQAAGPASRILIAGASGTGKLRLALALAHATGRRAAVVVETSFLPPEPARLARVLEALSLETELLGARLILRRVDNLVEGPRTASVLRQALGPLPYAVWMTSDHDASRADAPWLADLATVHVAVTPPDVELRRAAWAAELGRAQLSLDDGAVRTLAAEYPIARRAIETALALARPRLQEGAAGEVASTLGAAAASQMRGQLVRYGRRGRSKVRVDDLVLTEGTAEQVAELLSAVRRRTQVMEQWGLAERHAIGRGLVALFNGPPGTGKTLTANALANEIGLPLYRIDVSSLVDRYVGETEKNLVRLFEEAAASRAVLLFDEADSLFGRRIEAEDATDRFANMQVNLLLNLIEDYDGVAILTTNLKGALDTAFLRRIVYKLAFEMPEHEQLVALWDYHLPPAIPRDRSVDLEQLADEFDSVAGGDIKNAVLRAALAARDGEPITQELLRRAMINELRANGNVIADRL
jgi:ATP-dependent 26S proteasome regulatory subunit